MTDNLKRVLSQSTYKVGQIFTVSGLRYMFITPMVLKCLDTDELFMRGFDF